MRLGVAFVLRVLSAGLLMFWSTSALAIPLSLQVYADGVLVGDVDETHLGCVDNPDGVSAECEASGLQYAGEYPLISIDNLDLSIDADPVVTGTLSISNLDVVTQRITMVFTLPIAPIPGSTLSSGSISGSVNDALGDGATVSAPNGASIYSALIDGVTVATLHPYMTAFSAGAFATEAIAAAVFGPQVEGAALTDIGIILDFELTGLDSVTITSEHVVLVPEPRTLALLALGLAGLAGRRRLR